MPPSKAAPFSKARYHRPIRDLCQDASERWHAWRERAARGGFFHRIGRAENLRKASVGTVDARFGGGAHRSSPQLSCRKVHAPARSDHTQTQSCPRSLTLFPQRAGERGQDSLVMGWSPDRPIESTAGLQAIARGLVGRPNHNRIGRPNHNRIGRPNDNRIGRPSHNHRFGWPGRTK